MSNEKLYVMLFDQAMKSGAQRMLYDVDGRVIMASDRNTLGNREPDADVHVVFVSGEIHFPSKYIRVFKSLDIALTKRVIIPEVIRTFIGVRPVRVVLIHPQYQMTPQLKKSLTNLHFQNSETGAWEGPKRKAPSRQERSRRWRAHHQRIREDMYATN